MQRELRQMALLLVSGHASNKYAIFSFPTDVVVLLTVLWENSTDDNAMNTFVSRWVERATRSTHELGKYHPWLYINYASKDQDPFSGYGERNLQRLRDIQRTVDPTGVFSSTGLCRGYFKLL